MAMQKLRETIVIDAPREKVWDIMLSEPTYTEWTKPFGEGARMEGSFTEGAEVRFIGPDPETGKDAGMVAVIRESRKPEFLSMEHIGIIMDGVADTTSEEAKKWSPAFENYTFNEKDGGTEVVVEVDILEEHRAMFEEAWPKALAVLKELSEK